MSVTAVHRGHLSLAQESDRAQAAYFLDELQRHVTQLDEDVAKLQGLLALYQHRNQGIQVARIQRDLRQVALQRREILNMVTALSCRFKP